MRQIDPNVGTELGRKFALAFRDLKVGRVERTAALKASMLAAREAAKAVRKFEKKALKAAGKQRVNPNTKASKKAVATVRRKVRQENFALLVEAARRSSLVMKTKTVMAKGGENPRPVSEKEDRMIDREIIKLNEGLEKGLDYRLVHSLDKKYTMGISVKGNAITVEGKTFVVNGVIPFRGGLEDELEVFETLNAMGFARLLAGRVMALNGYQASRLVREVIGKFGEVKPTNSATKRATIAHQVRMVDITQELNPLVAMLFTSIDSVVIEELCVKLGVSVMTGKSAADGRFMLSDVPMHTSVGMVRHGETLWTLFKKLNQQPARLQLDAHLETLAFDNEHLVEKCPIHGLLDGEQTGIRMFTAVGQFRQAIGGGCVISASAAEAMAVRQPVTLADFRNNGQDIQILVKQGDYLTRGDVALTIDGEEVTSTEYHGVVVSEVIDTVERKAVLGYYRRPVREGDKLRRFLKATVTEVRLDWEMPIIDGRRVEVIIGHGPSVKNPAFQLELAGWTGAVLPEDEAAQNAKIAAMEEATLFTVFSDLTAVTVRSGMATFNVEGPGVDVLGSVKMGSLPISTIGLAQLAGDLALTFQMFDADMAATRKGIMSLISAANGSGNAEMAHAVNDELRARIRECVLDGSINSPYLLENDPVLMAGGKLGMVLKAKFKLVLPAADIISEFFVYEENNKKKLSPVFVAARRLLADFVMPLSTGVVKLDVFVKNYYQALQGALAKLNLAKDFLGLKQVKVAGRIEFDESVPVGVVLMGRRAWEKAGCPLYLTGSRTPTISQDGILAWRVVVVDDTSEFVLRFHPETAMILMNADCDGDGIALVAVTEDRHGAAILAEMEARVQKFELGVIIGEFVEDHYGEASTKYDEEMNDATKPIEWGVKWTKFQMNDVRRMIAFASSSQKAVGLATNVVSGITCALVKAVDVKLTDRRDARRIQNVVARAIQGALDGMKHMDIKEILLDIHAGRKQSVVAELGEFERKFISLVKRVEKGQYIESKQIDAVVRAALMADVPLTRRDLQLVVRAFQYDDVKLARKLIRISSSRARFDQEIWNGCVEAANSESVKDSPIAIVQTFRRFGKIVHAYDVPVVEGADRVSLLVGKAQAALKKNGITKALTGALITNFIKVHDEHRWGWADVTERFAKKAGDFKQVANLPQKLILAILTETNGGLIDERMLAAYAIQEAAGIDYLDRLVAKANEDLKLKSTKPVFACEAGIDLD